MGACWFCLNIGHFLVKKNSKKKSSGGKVSFLIRLIFKIILGFIIITLFPVILFRFVPPPITSFMIQRKVEALIEGRENFSIRHKWVAIEKISLNLPLAIMAAEDQLFPEHHGFDLASIEKAFKRNSKRPAHIKGASTLTQQIAKNLFLWPSRSYLRKGVEAWFTLLIELCWSKERILEVYLNSVEFGDGVFGVQAAGRIFYGKNASNISISEAALLAAVLPNPRRYSVKRPSNYVLRRKEWIIRQMGNLGGISYSRQIL